MSKAKNVKTDAIVRPVVWVVGASRGIGKEIAKQFAMIGCEVCLSSRTSKDIENVVHEIIELGGRAYSFPADISKPAEITKTIKLIAKKFSRIDVLINNAGVSYFKNFEHTSEKQIHEVLTTNLVAPISCIKQVLPGMMKRKSGWIINILSVAAIKTFKGSSAYTASKAGLHGFSKVIREEMRDYNIKVVNILPAATETVMWPPMLRKKYGKRMMTAQSVAEAILSVYRMPADIVVEDIVLRPIKGDIE